MYQTLAKRKVNKNKTIEMTKKKMISELEILKKKVECKMDDILTKYRAEFQTEKFNELNSCFNNYTDIIKGLKAEKSNRFDYEFYYGTDEEPMGINVKG